MVPQSHDEKEAGSSREWKWYNKALKGPGVECEKCKIVVAQAKIVNHRLFCFYCEVCRRFKTNKAQHAKYCRPLSPSKNVGQECPYCQGYRYPDLLRHVKKYHRLPNELTTPFRKNTRILNAKDAEEKETFRKKIIASKKQVNFKVNINNRAVTTLARFAKLLSFALAGGFLNMLPTLYIVCQRIFIR